MAELTIRPEEIRDALDAFVQSYDPTTASREEIGRVSEAGDGIARVEGLPGVMANELLRFEDGTLGLALNLDVREIGVVILGEFSGIEEGQEVRRTGEILSVPVGDAFLGRVVDPLGNPIDGLGDIQAEARRALELQAPTVVQRQSVKEPLMTGIKAIDSMTPIGRGQRQLIIGDRQTGKSAIAIDTIINQKANWASGDPKLQVRCIYVAIGQKGSTISGVRAALEENGAMEYTTIVAAPASDPAGFKYLAPYTGSAIGQHWMYAGQHVLIVFDDLSKQADAYRAVSLLLRRPPGREAYPGRRLLPAQPAARALRQALGRDGWRLDDGPAVRRDQAGTTSRPTSRRTSSRSPMVRSSSSRTCSTPTCGRRSTSASRSPASAARRRPRRCARSPARCGWTWHSSARSRRSPCSPPTSTPPRAPSWPAARGWWSSSSSGSTTPYPMEEQVISIFAGTSGLIDDLPVEDVRRFESELLEHLRREGDILATIRETREFGEDTEKSVRSAIEEFKRNFVGGGSSSPAVAPGHESAEPMDAEDVDQERIVRQRRG